MTKRIAMFNHKGGVSKTTTTFHLAWMLAEKGNRVVMVDADPQCNLTGIVIGQDKFEAFYKDSKNNIKDNLMPAFKAQPRSIEPVECIEVKGVDGLFLLPGHIGLAEYEVTLGMAQELSSSIFTLQNIPGSFSYLLEKTAEKYNADYIIIDMNPGLGSINQNLLMTSDYFIIPTSPDYFSIMALESLASILPQWYKWSQIAGGMETITQEAAYPFPQVTPKLLGIVVQRYTLYKDIPSKNFQNWIDNIYGTIQKKFIPELQKIEMSFSNQVYSSINHDNPYCLAEISDFATLVAISQRVNAPVFALTDKQLGYSGQVLKDQKKRLNKFNNIFSTFADRIIQLTNDASSN
ncbi:MAG: AAA family ATPase [Candidatus Marithrix sp.]|nr:AAA family ATPase [Candidatus Marithrix sp.]